MPRCRKGFAADLRRDDLDAVDYFIELIPIRKSNQF
jgi:hypothetical protein